MLRRRLISLLFVAVGLGGLWAGASTAAATLPPLYHVYVIVLENESASTTFGPHSPAPYLSHTLRSQGAYLPNYYGIGHQSNDNYLAMISGQAPNAETQSDCQVFNDFLLPAVGPFGQVSGPGCVYPAGTPTLPGQLGASGLVWRDYNEDMGNDPARESGVCGHPGVDKQDGTQSATATDQYATRHNPFVYFHDIIDNTTLCDTHVVGSDALPADLANADSPNFTFITPNLCHDGHDSPCRNGEPGGLTSADAFLRRWVPAITGSPGFRRGGGLLVITFDEADTSDARACCGEIAGPGSPSPGVTGPGGGQVGAVLLSPYIAPGTVSTTPYNHYSLLRSVEDLFDLGHIGYAGLPGETSFGRDIFACEPSARPVAVHGRLPAGSEIQGVRLRRRGRLGEQLQVYSVGNSILRAVVRASSGRRRGRAPRPVRLTRTLVPCRTYTLNLPRRDRHHPHRVTVAASAGGGSQRYSLRY